MRKFYNEDLQHQYDHDSHFRSRVDHSQMAYCALLKRAAEEPLPEGMRDSMLERFIGDDNHCTYFFYGCLQPKSSREKELLLYIVRNFQPEPGVPFTFVYFNHHTPSSDFYFRFKNVFDLLPLRVIEMMRTFYLVKPYFYIKAFDMLGQSNRIFAATYCPIDSCVELVKREDYKVHDFVTFIPEEISQEFPSHLKRRPSLLTYRINVEGQNLDEEQLKEKRDFENSVRALITKQVYKLENYELGEMGIPMVLQLLVGYFKEKPQALLQEGIFRKSVSIDEQNQTLEQLGSRNFGYLHQITNPHLIASLIKKFFTNLKEPIIPFALFDRLMHDQGVANKREFIKQLLATLPPLNFISLMFVIQFLKKDVAPLQPQTKMSAHNLAICFSPALMRSEKPSMADIINASKSVMVTEIMINEFDELFGHEQQRNKLFEKSIMDRRIDFKRNLKEELHINIDDRTSEEVHAGQFVLEGHKQELHTYLQNTQQVPPLQPEQPPLLQNVSPPLIKAPQPTQQSQHHSQQPQNEVSPPKTSHHSEPKSSHPYQPAPAQDHPVWGTLITRQSVALSKQVYKSDKYQENHQPYYPRTEEIQIKPEVTPPLHQTHSESFLLLQPQEEEQRPKSKKTRQELVQLIMKNKQEASEPQPIQSSQSPPSSTFPEPPKSAVTRSTITFAESMHQK